MSQFEALVVSLLVLISGLLIIGIGLSTAILEKL